MGKLTDEEKGLLSMVQCRERKDNDHGAESVMFIIFSVAVYGLAAVIAVAVFLWGQS